MQENLIQCFMFLNRRLMTPMSQRPTLRPRASIALSHALTPDHGGWLPLALLP